VRGARALEIIVAGVTAIPGETGSLYCADERIHLERRPAAATVLTAPGRLFVSNLAWACVPARLATATGAPGGTAGLRIVNCGRANMLGEEGYDETANLSLDLTDGDFDSHERYENNVTMVALGRIDGWLSDGLVVVLHCRAGFSRSPSVATDVLLYCNPGMPYERARACVTAARPYVLSDEFDCIIASPERAVERATALVHSGVLA